MYVFICIGTTEIIGDSLGPMVGSLLEEKYKNNNNIKIYGNMKTPVDFYNVDKIINSIEYKYSNKATKIIVDSALGNKIGSFVLTYEKNINLGEGFFKRKIIKGDICIAAIVGKNHENIVENFLELRSINRQIIRNMAEEIVRAIEI